MCSPEIKKQLNKKLFKSSFADGERFSFLSYIWYNDDVKSIYFRRGIKKIVIKKSVLNWFELITWFFLIMIIFDLSRLIKVLLHLANSPSSPSYRIIVRYLDTIKPREYRPIYPSSQQPPPVKWTPQSPVHTKHHKPHVTCPIASSRNSEMMATLEKISNAVKKTLSK